MMERFSLFYFSFVLASLMPTQIFSQNKLPITLENQYKLDSTDYFRDRLPFFVNKQAVYFIDNDQEYLSVYKNTKSGTEKVFGYELKEEHFINFVITDEVIFLLFQHHLLKFNLSDFDGIPLIKDFALAKLDLSEWYYSIYSSDGKIVLTSCYNEAKSEGQVVDCPYKVVDGSSLDEVLTNRLCHDAVGLTHLTNYFYDVNFGKILFVNSLTHKAYIYNLEDTSPVDSVGNFALINKGVDQIPFSTRIIPFSNPKGLVGEISQFASKINYLEGGAFLTDSVLFLVEKLKGNARAKRLIHFYAMNEAGKWELRASKSFMNEFLSKRYGLFQFYYVNGFKIHDGKIYITEVYVPSVIRTKSGLIKYVELQDQPNFGLYEYKMDF